jgi:hypothetical protein
VPIKYQIIRLLYKGLILLGIVFLFDFAIGKTLEHFYFTQASGPFYRTTYSLDSTNADILIFGSSRANHHYDPRVFEDSLGMTCYNTGRDGNFLLYNFAVFKTVIARYTPKIVIFDVNRNELSSTADDYERLSSLLPYKNQNSTIDQMIALRGPYEKIKCLSQIYPYNSLLLTIAIGNTRMNRDRQSDINGFVPVKGIWNQPIADIDSTALNKIDPNKEKALKEIINDCKSKGIRLLLVNSPAFLKSIASSDVNPIRQIAETGKVEFLDYSTDTAYLNNHNYFFDPLHLNDNGATMFSKALAAYLNNSEMEH